MIMILKREKLKNILLDKKISITENRLDILEILNDNHHFHSIQEIVNHLSHLNTKTIYNNIKALLEVGILDSYSFEGLTKYNISDTLTGRKNVAHIIKEVDNVEHINLDEQIFNDIKKICKKNNIDCKKIKIFIHS